MAKKSATIARPVRTTEFAIIPSTTAAHRGWIDLAGTKRNALVDAWDALTRDPLDRSPSMHPLRGSLQCVMRDGVAHEQWQLELPGGARIWYYVDDRVVHLVQVHTHHPNATK